MVSYLTEGLVEREHAVTLFASGDSVTRARLRASCERSLRLDPDRGDHILQHVLMLEQVARLAPEFDVVHYHVDYLHFPFSRRERVPQLTTLHGRLDLADLPLLYREYAEMPVVSISDAQREPLPQARWLGTVHHGLPLDLYRFRPDPGDYLVFVGRISPEKRLDRAIEIARRAGLPLRVAAKVDDADRPYFESEIEPLLEGRHVEFLGEVGEREKETLFGGALALLFPIDWPEPFGLVMIESLACGTPVVAFPGGSVPEVIDPGRTGFLVESVDEAVAAVRKVPRLDRHACRQAFEERFSAPRMARDYVALYARVMRESGRSALDQDADVALAPQRVDDDVVATAGDLDVDAALADREPGDPELAKVDGKHGALEAELVAGGGDAEPERRLQ
jgi:glycosyltransferase involved in cell wall biosynthesis